MDGFKEKITAILNGLFIERGTATGTDERSRDESQQAGSVQNAIGAEKELGNDPSEDSLDSSHPSFDEQANRMSDGGVTVQRNIESTDRPRIKKEPPTVDELLVGADSDVTPVLSVVIPTMNEGAGIGTCLDWIEEAVLELGVQTEIIVSDASTDRTPEIARERGAIVVEPDEMGYGYAYRYAFQYARGEYIVMGDADTTYDFSEIPRLLEHLWSEKADIVMGSRLEGDIKPGAMPALHQYVGNPVLTRFLNAFYNAGVSDAHSGFRVFRSEVLDQIELTGDGMEFASEMVMKAGANSLDIVEVPITYHEREGEAKLESFRDGWRHVRFMLVNAPGYLFSVPAAVFGVVGLAMMVTSLVATQLSGVFFGTHTMILGSLFTLIGFQAACLAVFSAIATDPIQSPDDGITQWIRNEIRLEHGIAAGLTLFTLGAAYMSVSAVRWIGSSGAVVPSVPANILAFTAVLLGTQAVFSSFFLSMIADGARA